MVTTSGVVLAYVLPIVIVVIAVLYIVYYIRKHKKRLTSADGSYGSDTRAGISGSGSAATADSSGTSNTAASGQPTSIGSNGRPRRQRYRRRRRLRNFLTGNSNPDDPEERRSLFGHHGDHGSTTNTRSTTRSTGNSRQQQQARRNRNRAPRQPRAPPPTRGKEDEEWADAYNHVLRDNPYALTLYELDAMFPAQQFKREKHDLYRLARRTSMKARELHRRSLQRASSALRNSTVSAAIGSNPPSRPTSAIGNRLSTAESVIPPVPPIETALSQSSLVDIGGSQPGAVPGIGARPQTPISQTISSPRAPFQNELGNFSDVSLSSVLHESNGSPFAQPLPKGPMAYGSSIVRPASVAAVGAVSSASINPRNSNIRRNISLPSHRSAPTTPAAARRFASHRAHTLDEDEDHHLLHHLDNGPTAYDSYAHGDLERGPDPALSREPIVDQDDSDYEWVYEEYTDNDDEPDNERRRRRDDLARNDSDNESIRTNENWLQTVASMFSPLGPATQNVEYNDLHDLNPPQISDEEAGMERRHSGARRLRPLRSASADGHLRGRHSDEDAEAEDDSDEDLVLQAAAVSRGASLKRLSAAAGLAHHFSLPAAPRVNRHTSTMSASGMAIRNAIHTIPESSAAAAATTGATSVPSTSATPADAMLISTATSPAAGQPDLSVVHEDSETEHTEEEKPVSHVQIVGEDNDFVFCPICQGTIREKEEDEKEAKPEPISEEPEEGTESDEATRVEEEGTESDEKTGKPGDKETANGETSAAAATTTNDLEDNDHIVRLLSCNHVFHDECITPWLTTSKALCPLCKRDFRNEIPVEVLRAESV